jgi:hypothetical protein
MGNNRSCEVFSIENALRKKPALYVSVSDKISSDGSKSDHLLYTILHLDATEDDLIEVWNELEARHRQYMTEEDCVELMQRILVNMEKYLQLQLKSGREAVKRVARKEAAAQGVNSEVEINKLIENKQQRYETEFVAKHKDLFEQIRNQASRDPKPLGEALFKGLAGNLNRKVSQEVFLKKFCEQLAEVCLGEKIEIVLKNEDFFPYGSGEDPKPAPAAASPDSDMLANSVNAK